MRFPPNLRILAAVDGGFVALDTAAATYVVWNGAISRPLVPENSALLATTPRLVAFARDCVERGCTLEIDDASTGRSVLVEPTHEVYRSATFSPSAKSLAAVSTDGRVTIIDVRSGVSLEESSRSIGTLNAGMPVSWTGENTLLVVEHRDVRLAPSSNRLPVSGIQQVVALP